MASRTSPTESTPNPDAPAAPAGPPAPDPIDAISVLAEPTRRRLHAWVIGQGRAVGRDEAAAAVGISRALTAHHLDRLVSAGLLVPEFRRLSGRTGPGAGRPAKLYRQAPGTVEISIPPRRYELAARLLAEGHEDPAAPGPPIGVRAAGSRHGRELGEEARRRAGRRPTRRARRSALLAVLDESGYAPVELDRDEIRLANCPFDALVDEHRDLVCGMNVTVAEGLLAELGDDRLTAELDPRPGWCCVAIRTASAAT